MPLLNQAVVVPGQIGKLFDALRQGQAPDKVSRQFLKDIGFSSSNHLAFIPLLKGLGFLTADGAPTMRYREMLDSTRWRKILGEAVREAYSDIFVLKAKPTKVDKPMIMGKYKTTYNMSDISAERAAATFLNLLELAGEEAYSSSANVELPPSPPSSPPLSAPKPDELVRTDKSPPTSLHYNIQIHLPATKDVEVYNAIFRSLREHLID